MIALQILLLSPPLSYPLPLLSLTTHLALLNTALPALLSTGDEDPLFNDDWAAAEPLYPQPGQKITKPVTEVGPSSKSSSSPDSTSQSSASSSPAPQQKSHGPTSRSHATGKEAGAALVGVGHKPPITLLLTSHGPSAILFDPSAAELAVADSVLAVTITSARPSLNRPNVDPTAGPRDRIEVLSLRSLDPPSRLCSSGSETSTLPNDAFGSGGGEAAGENDDDGIWRARRGGVNRGVLKRMVELCVKPDGVGEEVLRGLATWA